MSLGRILDTTTFLNQAANILGINNWPLQEATYNGATFHWMQPSYAGVDPIASLVEYAQKALDGVGQKPNYSTWSNLNSFQDGITKKLGVYSIPNYNGVAVDEFGLNEVEFEFVGLIFGTDYMTLLETLNQAFLDEETFLGSGIGKSSKSNFRTLTHPIYSGPIKNVYYRSHSLITSSDKFQCASFKLSLLAADPSFLMNSKTSKNTWQQEAQKVLNAGEGIGIGIGQTFSLGQSFINGSFTPSPTAMGSSISEISFPIINGRGLYLNSIVAEIERKLTELSNLFTNCMAFLVQTDGGAVKSPYWEGVTVDLTILPIFLAPGQKFTQSDAQVIIQFYNDAVDVFYKYSSVNGFDYNLQNNFFAIATSLALLSQFSEIVLTQNKENVSVVTTKLSDLYTVMFNNQVDFAEFENINFVQNGAWYSCLTIPPGTKIDMS